jgi:acyl-CoA dehydrogenase
MSPNLESLRAKVREFVNTVAIPREPEITQDETRLERVRAELQLEAKGWGLMTPQLPVELGGLGLPWLEASELFIEAGRSLLGVQALNISAPDEGNMHLLHLVADDAQKTRYLEPLVRAEIRSCFSMTEPPPGAGSDPSMLRGRAERVNGQWRLEAGKWFISGAQGAAFTLILAHAFEGETPLGATIFILPMDTPGVTLKRVIPTLDRFTPGHHCELEFSGVMLDDDAVLGEVGKGFDYAQLRLDPARLTHCMRWLGTAVRALEIAEEYAVTRESFGQRLAQHQMVQDMIAQSHIDIHASRLLIRDACGMLDRGERVRHEASMTKVFVSEAVNRVLDRCLQICGSYGVSEDIPISQFWREARPFRIYDGANEVHKMSIARRVLKRAAARLEAER